MLAGRRGGAHLLRQLLLPAAELLVLAAVSRRHGAPRCCRRCSQVRACLESPRAATAARCQSEWRAASFAYAACARGSPGRAGGGTLSRRRRQAAAAGAVAALCSPRLRQWLCYIKIAHTQPQPTASNCWAESLALSPVGTAGRQSTEHTLLQSRHQPWYCAAAASLTNVCPPACQACPIACQHFGELTSLRPSPSHRRYLTATASSCGRHG